MSGRRTQTTTERGLGWAHKQQRARLLASHRDGDPCPCLNDDTCGPSCLCRPHGYGQPMYRTPASNPDGMPLEADHTLSRSQGGKRADRLLLATCNRSRGSGTRSFTAMEPRPQPWWTRQWF